MRKKKKIFNFLFTAFFVALFLLTVTVQVKELAKLNLANIAYAISPEPGPTLTPDSGTTGGPGSDQCQSDSDCSCSCCCRYVDSYGANQCLDLSSPLCGGSSGTTSTTSGTTGSTTSSSSGTTSGTTGTGQCNFDCLGCPPDGHSSFGVGGGPESNCTCDNWCSGCTGCTVEWIPSLYL